MIRKLIYKMRKRRFCKLNNWNCSDCIYHDFVFEGVTFRGNRCRYPQYEERKEREMRLALIVSAIGVGGFIFLAWNFNHWWIALFGLLFMYSYEGSEK